MDAGDYRPFYLAGTIRKKEEAVRKFFFELYDIFLTSKDNLSEGREKHYKVFFNILKRYELYINEYLDTLTRRASRT